MKGEIISFVKKLTIKIYDYGKQEIMPCSLYWQRG
jgi:hypothetical protein